MHPHTLLISALAALGFLAVPASFARAEPLFVENFNDGSAASRWSTSQIGSGNSANFAFDYESSTFNIPAAPRGGGLGLRLDTNATSPGAVSAIMAFPNGQSFSGPHTLSFDLWLQYSPGTDGTTEFAIFGLNHTSTAIRTPTAGVGGPPTIAAIGPSPNGVDYTIVGDNGANRDVRVYFNGTELPGTAGGYVGSGTTAPLIQETGQPPYTDAYTGTTPGNQWLQVEVTSLADRAIFKVNGELWAETTSLTATPGNLMLGTMDLFTSVAAQPVFALYDNVTVAVPEPSTAVALALGAACCGGWAWRRRRTAAGSGAAACRRRRR
jgi:hypothetical protein